MILNLNLEKEFAGNNAYERWREKRYPDIF
jgi:hypothetical protein